jgi:hypothetical protein
MKFPAKAQRRKEETLMDVGASSLRLCAFAGNPDGPWRFFFAPLRLARLRKALMDLGASSLRLCAFAGDIPHND